MHAQTRGPAPVTPPTLRQGDPECRLSELHIQQLARDKGYLGADKPLEEIEQASWRGCARSERGRRCLCRARFARGAEAPGSSIAKTPRVAGERPRGRDIYFGR